MTASARSAVAPPAKSVLSECRDIAHSRLAEVVAGALAKIDEDLFALADKSIKRDEQQVYLDAMTRVRQHRCEIQSKFEECFRAIYDKRLESGRGEASATAVPNADQIDGLELSLVSDSIIETGMAIDRLANTVLSAVDNNELLGIRARFGMLLNREALEDADNPLSPEAIFEALKLACNHIPAEDAVKQAMLSAFQPYLSKSITQVYHAVNESLLAHHILPRIRHSIKSNPDSMGVSQRMMGLSASQRMSTLSQSGRLAQFAGAAPGDAGAGIGGAPGHEQATIAGLLAAIAQGQGAARAQGLRYLADADRFDVAGSATPASASLLEVLAQLQKQANLGDGAGFLAPGFLRAIDRELVVKGTPLDQLTVELVALVFDYLQGDDKIAEPVKGLIARLQIVAVKAAILDRSFFARRAHPMRRLLDKMAEAGADPVVSLADERPFMRGVKHLVDDLVIQFNDDVSIFETALAELDSLVHGEHEVADAAIQKRAEELAAKEALAAADAAVRTDLAARVKPETPVFIHEFLSTVWARSVVEAQVNTLEGDDSVAARLNIAADLIWSVEPKARADIPVLAAMLPGTVRGLIRGVMSQGVPDDVRQKFFNQLMKAHTEAIAAAKLATNEVVSQPVPSQSAAMPALAAAPIAVPGDVHARTVLELVKGETLEFTDRAGGVGFKLTWISPKRTFFLFTNGTRMQQMSAEVLTGLFRQGVAVLRDESVPIVDRAIDALVAPAPAVGLAA